jgi:hypothetical protein
VSKSDDSMSQWQTEVLSTIRTQQEAYLQALAKWRESVELSSRSAGAAPTTPPVPPKIDSMPSPAELMESNRAFMEKVLSQQQEFLAKLTASLGGSD